MTRRLTREEALELGRTLPISLAVNYRGEPLMSRADWEKLPRSRRVRDRLLFRRPPKDPEDDSPVAGAEQRDEG